MNALRLLMLQHDRVEGLLVDLGLAVDRSEQSRQQVLEEFGQALRQHLNMEETHFYPVIAERLILVAPDRFLEEHKQLRGLLYAVEVEAPGEAFARRLESLHRLIVQHVSDEEIELFPEVKRRFTLDELDVLGDRIGQALERANEPGSEAQQEAGELAPDR